MACFWGKTCELLDEQVNKFNASQNKYTVVHTRKGNYSETLNAGIAAFRAGQHPNILMVFEVGIEFNGCKRSICSNVSTNERCWSKIQSKRVCVCGKRLLYYDDGKMLSMPYNSSTPVLWVNKDLMKKQA